MGFMKNWAGRGITAIAAGVIGTALMMEAGYAKDWPINEMTYRNNGAYVAHFNVRYNHQGNKCSVYLDGQAYTSSTDQNVTVDLTSDEFEVHSGGSGCKGAIPDGAEVWGKVFITAGEDKSCRKDGTKFIYIADSNNTASYRSGGTTGNNNRCKISDKD